MINDIICLNTGEVFKTFREAGRKYNIDKGSISDVCKGKRNSAGTINGEKGKWMFYEDFLKLNKE